MWEPPKEDSKYVLSTDPCDPSRELSVVHLSEVGHWTVDNLKDVIFTAEQELTGTEITHLSFTREELGDPLDPEWWNRLLKGIQKKADEHLAGGNNV